MQFELGIRPEAIQIGVKMLGLLLERAMAQSFLPDTTTLSLVCDHSGNLLGYLEGNPNDTSNYLQNSRYNRRTS